MFKRCWWLFLVMALIGPFIGWAVTALATSTPLWLYQTEAVVEVRPLSSEKPANSNDPVSSESGDSQVTPGWLRSAAVEMKSDALLGKVVDHLKLTKKWGVDREITIRALAENVQTQNVRSSDLISVRVWDKDNEDARDIAIELANRYKRDREEIERCDQKRRQMELSQAIKDQEDKVQERQKLLANFKPNRRENIVWEGTETLLHLPVSRQEADDERNLEIDQELLNAMKRNGIIEMISAKMPVEAVIIHVEPQIALSPDSLNVTLNLLYGAALGFLLALLGTRRLIRPFCAKEGGTSAHPG